MGNQGSFYQSFDYQTHFTNPTGLYKSNNNNNNNNNKQSSNANWTVNEAKKLIMMNRLAPRYPGTSSEKLAMKYGTRKECDAQSTWEECPICFRFYPEVNSSSCCNQKICSECYLNISHPSKVIDCPFCLTPKFNVVYMQSPHGKEAACHEMIACLREEGNKSWEMMDGESSDHLYTATSETMKELERESVVQAYQAEADRLRISLSMRNQNKKQSNENCIPERTVFTPTRSLSNGSFGSSGSASAMDPTKMDEMMLIQALEASLKVNADQEKKINNNGSSASSVSTTAVAPSPAHMQISPMMYPTKQEPSGSIDTITSLSSSVPTTSPFSIAQRLETLSNKMNDSLPALSLPPPSASSSSAAAM